MTAPSGTFRRNQPCIVLVVLVLAGFIGFLCFGWLLVGWPLVYWVQLEEAIPQLREDTIAYYETIEHLDASEITDSEFYPQAGQLETTIGYSIDYGYVTEHDFDEVFAHYALEMAATGWALESSRQYEDTRPSSGQGMVGYILYRSGLACASIRVSEFQITRVRVRVWLDVDGQPYSPWRPPRLGLTVVRLGFPYEILTCPPEDEDPLFMTWWERLY